MNLQAHLAMPLNCDDAKYHARVWRTDVLKTQAIIELNKMLQAFTPERFVVKIEEVDTPVPGYPHAPRYKFIATLRDSEPNGSDAHLIAFGYTREGAAAHLLAEIVDGRGFYPMT